MARTLIRNGAVVSLDDAHGDIAGGDVLIEDDKIAALGRNLAAADAQIIDASGMVVLPGLVNSHIHTWEITLRGIGSDWVGGRDYFAHMHGNLAQRFEADAARRMAAERRLKQLRAQQAADMVDARGVQGIPVSAVRRDKYATISHLFTTRSDRPPPGVRSGARLT